MKITDKYVFFWNGSFSQWAIADMVVNDVHYISCEQFMMHKKALLFNDFQIAEQILNTHNPKDVKVLGRQVKNFNKDIWDSKCLSIVYQGNLAKFTQNNNLKNQLLNTGDRILVEASPYDRIWGVGLDEQNSLIDDPINWSGLNLLGFALTLVRNELKNE